MKLRNYGSVQKVAVGDGVFHLGWIPRGVHESIRQRMGALTSRVTRRCLLELRSEHLEDQRPEPTEAEVRERMLSDAELQAGMRALHMELVGWSVRGHEGVFDETGSPWPFETAERDFLGQQFACASDRMVERYAELPEFVDLCIAVMDRNRVDDDAKKNSPQPTPSAPSPGDGNVRTA